MAKLFWVFLALSVLSMAGAIFSIGGYVGAKTCTPSAMEKRPAHGPL